MRDNIKADMEDKPDYQLMLEKLCQAGDPRNTLEWAQGDPDYVKQFELGPEHIPALIDIAKKWVVDDDQVDDSIFYAPVHAWRALGQLRAVEAVEPLLAMQDMINDREGSDWYLEEFHEIFGLIGSLAIPALAAYLADQQKAEFPRVSTASGLREIAMRHPETRDQVIEILTRQLANYELEAYDLNALIICDLLDLKAVESAEVIERAYAAGVVDEGIVGCWSTVREELGIEGLGLVPERERKNLRDKFPWAAFLKGDNDLDDDFDDEDGFDDDNGFDDDMPMSIFVPDQGTHDLQQERERRKKEKIKQKRREKAKKRNRKKR